MAYLPLSTANLPDPAIDPAQGSSPEDYFNTVLYTGDGTTSNAITGVGYQPDLTWIKSRSASYNNYLIDAVRGSGYELISNNTNAEAATTKFVSFDADGFTVANVGGNALNANGATYVAWNWKANGSGVSNTDGSIPSQVSANTESGFSIVTYTGTGASATVGHGLNADVAMLIIKKRSSGGTARNWAVWHKALGGDNLLKLNLTDAVVSNSVYFGGGNHTSSVFELNTHTLSNENTYDFVAYCFAEVEGFSKFGSYTGNGSADGPFVYTGFRPAFTLIKRTDAAEDWWLHDSQRDEYNIVRHILYANASNAEIDGTGDNQSHDFLSNGFKLRTANANWNASGGTFIYMAFAENPFKYSNAR
jgi:hypothetical protein